MYKRQGDVDLTPFEQADRYNGKLTFDERARWIVTSNFAEIWIYDMNQKQPEPTKIALDELQSKYSVSYTHLDVYKRQVCSIL